MQTARNWLTAAVCACFLTTASCALFEPQSRIKSGQTYQTGQAQYDDYFAKVHALQVESAGWADEKKAARRNLIDALKIATDAVDVTILQATHERMVSIAHVVGPTRLDLRDDDGKVVVAEARADASMKDFVKALQTTLDGEMKRKRSLKDVPQRCDDLAKAGRELEPRVKADFFREGGTKMADVHDEIAASFEVLEQISKTSRLERRETEDFIADLGRAVIAEPGEFGHTEGTTTAVAKASPPPAQTSHPKPPPVAVNTTATTAPVSKPKPPPSKPAGGGGGDEVFNP